MKVFKFIVALSALSNTRSNFLDKNVDSKQINANNQLYPVTPPITPNDISDFYSRDLSVEEIKTKVSQNPENISWLSKTHPDMLNDIFYDADFIYDLI